MKTGVKAVDAHCAFVPFLRSGKPIHLGKIVDDPAAPGIGKRDKLSGVYIESHVARLDKGIPNPKIRPVLPLPWSLEFDFKLYPTKEIKEQEIMNLFVDGGRALGLGTFRGCFGKFEVASWD